MNTTDKATPTPWSLPAFPMRELASQGAIPLLVHSEKYGEKIAFASIHSPNLSAQEQDANAALIVLRVNAHEALVEALHGCLMAHLTDIKSDEAQAWWLSEHDRLGGHYNARTITTKIRADALDKARAALKLAKGEA